MASSRRFLVTITPDILRDGKLMVPKKFGKDYGKFLSSPVNLKIPNGDEWKLELTTVDGKVWLHEDWLEFTERYSLELGSLLVFRYVSSSTFDVMMFDETGCEIDYYCSDSESGEDEESKDDDDDSIEILENLPRRPKKREKDESLHHHEPCKKMRKAYSCKPKWEFEDEKDQSSEDETEVRTNVRVKTEVPDVVKAKAGVSTTLGICQKLKDLHWTQLSTSTNERASSFDPMKPSFVVSMRLAYLQRCNLNLPSGFVKEYLTDSSVSCRDVILETPDGKKWSAKLNSPGGISQPRAELYYGWRSFVKDNDLKDGDVCVFELSESRNKYVFNVIAFRLLANHVQDLRRVSRKGSSSRSLNASETGNNNRSEPRNPFFQVTLHTRSYRHPILDIPLRFGREHLSASMKTVKLLVENKQWEVKLLNHIHRFRFSAGWVAFQKENALRDGVKCVFEMVSKKDCAFKVTIIRDV